MEEKVENGDGVVVVLSISSGLIGSDHFVPVACRLWECGCGGYVGGRGVFGGGGVGGGEIEGSGVGESIDFHLIQDF